MIIYNGKRKEFTPEEKKLYGKKCVYINKTSSTVNVKVGSRETKKTMFPPLHIMTSYSVYDKELREEVMVQYATHEIPKPDGMKDYLPNYLDFNKMGRFLAESKDVDKNFFLQNSPFIDTEENRKNNSQKIQFYLENLKGDAEKIARHKELLQEAQAKIWNKAIRLSDEDLKNIAISENMPNIDEADMNQIRNFLDEIANKNPLLFIEEKIKNAGTGAAELINLAIELVVIRYIGKLWTYVNENGQPIENGKIVGLSPGDEKMNCIVRYLSNVKNISEYQKLSDAVKAKQALSA